MEDNLPQALTSRFSQAGGNLSNRRNKGHFQPHNGREHGQLAYQGQVSGRGTTKHSDHSEPHSVLRLDNQPGEVRTQTHSDIFIHGLQIPPRLGHCKTHARQVAQTLGLDPKNKVIACFDCKMFDVANWVARLNGENGPRGSPSHETREYWRFPQWLDTLLPWSETILVHLKD